MLGLDSFQEADVIGITRPCTKWNTLVRSPDELRDIIPKAFEIARSGRPGPVVIDIPKDVAMEKTFLKPLKRERWPKVEKGYDHPVNMELIENVVKVIAKANKPLIYFGGGVVNAEASQDLTNFIEKSKIPAVSTLHGLGAVPGDHRLFLGMLGMHGCFEANMAVDQCDLLITLGARFDDRVTGKTSEFSKNSLKVHFEIDESNLNKTIEVDFKVLGDLGRNLKYLNKVFKERKTPYGDWLTQIDEWKKSVYRVQRKKNSVIYPEKVIKKLSDKTKGEAIVVSDVGQNQMWAAQYFKFQRPKSHLTSGGLGTMGFSVPASIGAAFGNPDLPIISISGDGGFQMNMQELITAKSNNLNVKFIILNNSFLGMVRQWQDLFHHERFSCTNLEDNPDFVKIGEAMRIESRRVTRLDELSEAIDWLFAEKGTYLLEIVIPKEEMVFPIIPSNSAVSKMITDKFSLKEGDS
jgi:acetolactate synthase-1/2/3 large subunit